MSRALGLLFLWLTAHGVVAQLIAAPWWIPNLTLIGLVLAVARAPRWWWLLAGLAGCFTLAGTARFERTILLAYLAVGGFIGWLAARWDIGDPRVQGLVTAAACVLMTAGALWLDGLWSWAALGGAALHVLLTGLAMLLVQSVR